MKKALTSVIAVSIFLIVSCCFAAQAEEDHPLISRFQGSHIYHYELKEFDEYTVPTGKMEDGKLSSSVALEGKVTRISYKAPAGRSTLEIQKNYEMTLKNAGFEILFECSKGECGKNWSGYTFRLNPLVDRNMEPTAGFTHGDERFQRFLSAKLSRPGGDIYATIYISQGWWNHPIVQLDVIETKSMETGMVFINMDAMSDEISKTGHVAIYGIHFDSGSSDVKPESEKTVSEIAKLLKQKPDLKLYVVGHTDNVGSFESNMLLSKSRAEAVVSKLVEEYQIALDRLNAHGVSSLVPVSTNKTAEGRAKNRRVDLVEQ